MPDEPTGLNPDSAEQAAGTQPAPSEPKPRGVSEEDFKGLQRAMSAADRRHKDELSARERANKELQEQLTNMSKGFDWLTETLLRLAPPEEAEAIQSALQKQQLQRLTDEIDAMKRGSSQPKQYSPQEAVSDEDFQELLRQAEAEAIEALEEAAREHGLDPREKGLEYGAKGESFAKRLKALNASVRLVKKAKAEADVASVKPQVSITPTRTSGGETPGSGFNKSAYESAFDTELAEARAKANKR